jgi:hypothetical protein
MQVRLQLKLLSVSSGVGTEFFWFLKVFSVASGIATDIFHMLLAQP